MSARDFLSADVDTHQLIFLAHDVRNIHVMGRGRKVLEFLLGENVVGNQMDFSVTVLASLRSGHFGDLARTAFDDDVTTLA